MASTSEQVDWWKVRRGWILACLLQQCPGGCVALGQQRERWRNDPGQSARLVSVQAGVCRACCHGWLDIFKCIGRDQRLGCNQVQGHGAPGIIITYDTKSWKPFSASPCYSRFPCPFLFILEFQKLAAAKGQGRSEFPVCKTIATHKPFLELHSAQQPFI